LFFFLFARAYRLACPFQRPSKPPWAPLSFRRSLFCSTPLVLVYLSVAQRVPSCLRCLLKFFGPVLMDSLDKGDVFSLDVVFFPFPGGLLYSPGFPPPPQIFFFCYPSLFPNFFLFNSLFFWWYGSAGPGDSPFPYRTPAFQFAFSSPLFGTRLPPFSVCRFFLLTRPPLTYF